MTDTNGKRRKSEKLPKGSTTKYEEALEQTEEATYVLRLYVTGLTPRSQKAIANVRKLCDEYLKGRYKLEIVDIYQHPGQAQSEQILAAPTLVKKLPLPLRRLIGDMTDPGRVLVALGLKIPS